MAGKKTLSDSDSGLIIPSGRLPADDAFLERIKAAEKRRDLSRIIDDEHTARPFEHASVDSHLSDPRVSSRGLILPSAGSSLIVPGRDDARPVDRSKDSQRESISHLDLPDIPLEQRPIAAAHLAKQALQEFDENRASARQKIEAAKALSPDDYGIAHLSARLHLQTGDAEKAARELRSADSVYDRRRAAGQVDDVDADFLISQAQGYLALSDSDRALARLDDVLLATPDNLRAKITKAQVLLAGIDRRQGVDLLLESVVRLRRGSRDFAAIIGKVSAEIDKLPFADRDERKKQLDSISISDYDSALSAILSSFPQFILDLRNVCCDAHQESLPVIVKASRYVSSPTSARDAVVDYAFAYLHVVRDSGLLEMLSRTDDSGLRDFSGRLVEASNVTPADLYVLFYSGEVIQVPVRFSPLLKSQCLRMQRRQLMETNVSLYDPSEVEGFASALSRLYASRDTDQPIEKLKEGLEEHIFSLCESYIDNS
jgi:tetratricopeptide (TPR) repeat protein